MKTPEGQPVMPLGPQPIGRRERKLRTDEYSQREADRRADAADDAIERTCACEDGAKEAERHGGGFWRERWMPWSRGFLGRMKLANVPAAYRP